MSRSSIPKIIATLLVLLLSVPVKASSYDMTKLIAAEYAITQNKVELAKQLYTELNSETQSASIAKQLTYIHLSQSNGKAAYITSQKWARLDTKSKDAQSINSYLAIKNQNYDSAKTSTEQLFINDNITAYDEILQIYNELNIDEKKVYAKLVNEVIAKHPENISALTSSIELNLLQEKWDLALYSVDELLRIKSDNNYAIILKAQLLQQKGRIYDSLKFLANTIEETPKNTDAINYYLTSLIKLEQNNIALKALYKIHTVEHLYTGEQLIDLAKMSLKLNDDELAKTFLTTASKKSYGYKARFVLGQLSEKEQRYNDAIYFYKTIPSGNLYTRANLSIAKILAKKNELTKAVAHLDKMYTTNIKEQREIDTAKARLLHDKGKHSEAIEAIEDSMFLFGDDHELIYLRSINQAKVNNWREAIINLEGILETQPGNTDILNSLGFILTEYANNYTKAKTHLDKAFKLSPHDPYVLDSLAWYHYKTGNKIAAIQLLNEATAIDDNPSIAAHYGEVLWNSGEEKEALKVWTQALDSAPDHYEVVNTMQKFSSFPKQG